MNQRKGATRAARWERAAASIKQKASRTTRSWKQGVRGLSRGPRATMKGRRCGGKTKIERESLQE
jgi:hypothetical protein